MIRATPLAVHPLIVFVIWQKSNVFAITGPFHIPWAERRENFRSEPYGVWLSIQKERLEISLPLGVMTVRWPPVAPLGITAVK